MDFMETEWTDVINITSVRKGIKKGGCIEIKFYGVPCILISETKIAYNDNVECVYIYDDMLFVKIKETIMY